MSYQIGRQTLTLILCAVGMTVLAASGLAPASAHAAGCPNEALRAEDNSTALPECRAYELVSPAYKEGYEFELVAASPNGETITGYTLGSVAGARQDSEIEGVFYSVSRGASGWNAVALEPAPASESCAEEPTCFVTASVSGESSLFVARSSSEPRAAIYRREADGSFVEVGPITPAAEPFPERARLGEGGGGDVVGASANLSTVVFRSPQDAEPRELELWPGDDNVDSSELATASLYEYTGSNNSAPVLVGVRGAQDSATSGESQLIGRCGTELGSEDSKFNAVSASGAVVFFTPRGGTCKGVEGEHDSGPAVSELWARVVGRESVAISEPTRASCASCLTGATTPAVEEKPAFFQGAAEDGGRVFFTTEQELLPGASGTNLYEYDFAAPEGQRVRLLSAAAGGVSELKGVVRIAAEGTRVYYVAGGVLAANANVEGASAQPGADNMYVYDAETDSTRFVATVFSEADEVEASAACDAISEEALRSRCHDNELTDQRLWGGGAGDAVTTPDGEFLVFVAGAAHLTADDATLAPQAFEYDAVSAELTRVSRGQGGVYNNDGNTPIAPAEIGQRGDGYAQSALPGNEATLSAVSANGSEVFFASGAALAPGAVSEENNAGCEFEEDGHCEAYAAALFASNFYEYRSSGAIDDGEVSLVDRASTALRGNESYEGVLFGTDASGENVFFSSTAPLVGQVSDSEVSVYDARVDGGFPAPTTPVSCSGEACQGPLSTAPSLPTPLSFSRPGGENLILATQKATAATGKPKITKRKVKNATVTLTVTAPAEGKLTASGSGVKTNTKAVKAAGKYPLRLMLTKAKRKQLDRQGSLTLKIEVAFKPSSGKPSKTSIKVTLGKKPKQSMNQKKKKSSTTSGRMGK